MNRIRRLMLGLAFATAAGFAHAQDGRGDVVYVPTPQIVVDEMLKMARITAKDYLIDLGSGDGRIIITAARQFGASGFGVDLDTYLLKMANRNAEVEGVADRARFYERNIFETRLETATVITSYLLPEMNRKLRPKLLALQPGTRVVAHDYHMGEWLPDDQKTIPVPEKQVGNPGISYIYLWYVPAKIAGNWTSRLNLGNGEVAYDFSFDQLFQEIEGTMRAGREATKFRTKVKADEISFIALQKSGERTLRHEFSGRIRGDTIEGTAKVGEGAQMKQVPWTARVTERREVRRPTDDVRG
jgi:methylase of polypeptide subunit release factors